MNVFLHTIRNFAMGTAVLLLFLGCADLLDGNVFTNFDGPPDADDLLKEYTNSDGTVSPSDADAFVADLEDAASSARFFRDLSRSDRKDLNTALESVFDPESGNSLETRQKAALLAGDVNMRGTDAGATANNVIDVLLDDDGIDTFEDPDKLFDRIIPDDARDDPRKVKRILDDLVAAGTAYEAFGQTLADGSSAPEGTNMGTVAQNALVAMTVKTIVGEAGDTASLAEKIVDGDEKITADFGEDGAFGEEGGPLRSIFDAAGLGGVLDSD